MSFSEVARFLPDTVDVLDGITDLSTHLLLIALHLRGAERRSLNSGQKLEKMRDSLRRERVITG